MMIGLYIHHRQSGQNEQVKNHMLQVKTYLGKSNLEGVGVFADVFIPKGMVVWKYNPYFTYMMIDQNYLVQLFIVIN